MPKPRFRPGLAALAALLLAAPGVRTADGYTYNEMEAVRLKALDKITARVSTLEAPLDVRLIFGTLEITVRACRKRPPEEPPESAAFLTVVERRPDALPTRLFQGWMFASSPALSALEHPVYDVWVIDCFNPSD